MPVSRNGLPNKVPRPNSATRTTTSQENNTMASRAGRELPKRPPARLVKPSLTSGKVGSIMSIPAEITGKRGANRYGHQEVLSFTRFAGPSLSWGWVGVNLNHTFLSASKVPIDA